MKEGVAGSESRRPAGGWRDRNSDSTESQRQGSGAATDLSKLPPGPPLETFERPDTPLLAAISAFCKWAAKPTRFRD